jgi:hypothetical protein
MYIRVLENISRISKFLCSFNCSLFPFIACWWCTQVRKVDTHDWLTIMIPCQVAQVLMSSALVALDAVITRVRSMRGATSLTAIATSGDHCNFLEYLWRTTPFCEFSSSPSPLGKLFWVLSSRTYHCNLKTFAVTEIVYFSLRHVCILWSFISVL